MTTAADGEFSRHSEAQELLSASFELHDLNGLLNLSTDERAAQLDARSALYSYVTRLWEEAKRQGLHPAHRPDFAAVAAMRDFAGALCDTIIEAQRAMRDEEQRRSKSSETEPAAVRPATVEAAHPDPYHPWIDRPVDEWWKTSRFTGPERGEIGDQLDEIVNASVEQLASKFLAQEPPNSRAAEIWALYELAAVAIGRLRFSLSIARTNGMTWSEIAAWLNVPDASAAWRLAAVPHKEQLVASWTCNACQTTVFEFDPGPDNTPHYLAGHAAHCPLDAAPT